MMQCHNFTLQWSPPFLLFVLVVCVQFSSALVSKAELPKELEDCYRSYSRWSLREVVGEELCWSCEAPIIHRLRKSKPREESPSAKSYVAHLMEKLNNIINGERSTLHSPQEKPRCIRKEYRLLTDVERNRFHDALNALKQDTSVSPNKYDVLAGIHSGPVLDIAHRGPSFLGWHRVYLLLIETELQEVDPEICLPYWDSSLDNELEDSTSSPIFSSSFLGESKPNGSVLTGPFAGWKIPEIGPLIRNIQDIGLFSEEVIRNILSQNYSSQVTNPDGSPINVIENPHNRVHNFIGGHMSQLSHSAHDPTFFLHHCFVDYVWELFRTHQRELSIDPQLDYPIVPSLPLHAPDRQMGFNFNITNIQGYSDELTRTYHYDPSPTCPFCGDSKYLLCCEVIQRCIPVDPEYGRVAQVPSANKDSSLSRRSEPINIQNTFCVDGICDTREWVYVPVELVSVRSPNLQTYESYPFYSGSIWRWSNIYQPSVYPEIARYIPSRHPKGYENCHENGIGQIFIQAQGLSYDGFYKESVIIDQRLATSHAVGYLAVKDPKNETVKTLFRAFDSCGRICKTAFKTPGTKRYESFSGVLDISAVPGRPRQYSHTYGQATLKTWGYSSNKECPSFVDNDIVFSFYCDYTEEIPWINKEVPAQKPDSQSLRSTAVSKTNVSE